VGRTTSSSGDKLNRPRNPRKRDEQQSDAYEISRGCTTRYHNGVILLCFSGVIGFDQMGRLSVDRRSVHNTRTEQLQLHILYTVSSIADGWNNNKANRANEDDHLSSFGRGSWCDRRRLLAYRPARADDAGRGGSARGHEALICRCGPLEWIS
jgi:hypothetical protein